MPCANRRGLEATMPQPGIMHSVCGMQEWDGGDAADGVRGQALATEFRC